MPKGAAVHYLRSNKTSGQSRRHIIFDTESTAEYDGHSETQSWLCGSARYLDRDTRLKEPRVTNTDYQDAHSLWLDVSDFTRPNARTLIWAHNLSYDLRIARALHILPELGWTLGAINLDGTSTWAKWTRDDHTLVMADFTSWATVPLARIGRWLKIEQKPRPENQDDIEGALERCRGDVEILSAAVVNVLEWLDKNDLGNLQITGSGQAMTAFRHRFMTHKILVHDDKAARRAERRALWAGRTEAWKHGSYTTTRTYEYDLPRAYATCARDLEVPTVYVGSVSNASVAQFRKWRKSRRLLCNCAIETQHPIVPTSNDDRIVWPVGKFDSWLWDCEVQALLDAGAKVTIGTTYVYTSEPCLHEWASWILANLDYVNGPHDQLQTRILKQWSRGLIGRFAMQYRSWQEFGTSPDSDLYISRMIHADTPGSTRLLQVGHSLFEQGPMQEGENPIPSITGYITAMCRVRLWDLMNAAGLETLYYVDTDSLIVDGRGRNRLEQRIEHDGAYGLIPKATINRLELHGPRQLVVDGERRYAGVPMRARPTGGEVVVGEVWEGLGEALRRRHGAAVIVHERAFNLQGQDRRRVWQADGSTTAVRLDHELTGPPASA